MPELPPHPIRAGLKRAPRIARPPPRPPHGALRTVHRAATRSHERPPPTTRAASLERTLERERPDPLCGGPGQRVADELARSVRVQGAQVIITPFVMFHVAGVQNAAVLR